MYSPDERRSIQNAMNADAMPSKGEAERMARNHLASEGCRKCGEDDPDNLSHRMILMPSCSAAQAPRDPRVVLCDDCHENRDTLRERAISKGLKRSRQDYRDKKTAGVIIFECENWSFVEADLVTEDPNHGKVYEDAHHGWTPRGPLKCRCGADIDEYVSLSEVDE